ncbi:MAG: NfeD family protein [Pseudomonadota bacterium]
MSGVETVQYWHWLAFGLGLLLVDVLIAGATVLMWLGIAALVTGAAAFLLPGLIGWQAQLVLFAVTAVASVFLWRRFDKRKPGGPTVNVRRGAEHIGRVVTLEEAIVGGHGRVRIDDTLWAVRGGDLPSGSRVRITAQDGNVFDVEPVRD